ncbi:hypothetical protein BGX26_011635 [Mortierella sp. AD094]|nr:hypothetical protein BGX26_011635 [Mortierella sp. AD094]
MSTSSTPDSMRLVVFGAAGQTGAETIKQVLAAGYQVTAASRRSTSMPSREGLTTVAVDINDATAVEPAMKEADAVISTLGVPANAAMGSQPITLYSASIKNMILAMHKHGIKRIIATTSAGIEPNPHPKGNFIWSRVYVPLTKFGGMGKNTFGSTVRMEIVLKESELE